MTSTEMSGWNKLKILYYWIRVRSQLMSVHTKQMINIH